MTTLTLLELAIMKSVWRRGQARVKQVREDIYSDRPLAYTTVMTVMNRLFKKGILRRTRIGRAHVYEPVLSEGVARDEAVKQLVRSFFGGSERALKGYLETGNELAVTDEGEEEEIIGRVATLGPVAEDAQPVAPGPPIEDSLL